jgi:hypothetical protein
LCENIGDVTVPGTGVKNLQVRLKSIPQVKSNDVEHRQIVAAGFIDLARKTQ